VRWPAPPARVSGHRTSDHDLDARPLSARGRILRRSLRQAISGARGVLTSARRGARPKSVQILKSRYLRGDREIARLVPLRGALQTARLPRTPWCRLLRRSPPEPLPSLPHSHRPDDRTPATTPAAQAMSLLRGLIAGGPRPRRQRRYNSTTGRPLSPPGRLRQTGHSRTADALRYIRHNGSPLGQPPGTPQRAAPARHQRSSTTTHPRDKLPDRGTDQPSQGRIPTTIYSSRAVARSRWVRGPARPVTERAG
jgi:hypothetical protein